MRYSHPIVDLSAYDGLQRPWNRLIAIPPSIQLRSPRVCPVSPSCSCRLPKHRVNKQRNCGFPLEKISGVCDQTRPPTRIHHDLSVYLEGGCRDQGAHRTPFSPPNSGERSLLCSGLHGSGSPYDAQGHVRKALTTVSARTPWYASSTGVSAPRACTMATETARKRSREETVSTKRGSLRTPARPVAFSQPETNGTPMVGVTAALNRLQQHYHSG